MNINPVSFSNVSFKSTIPVRFFAKEQDGKYHQIEDVSQIKTCQSKLTRILNNNNSAAKSENVEKFINFYKAWDKDYAKNGHATSVLPKYEMWHSYLITGEDAIITENRRKEVETNVAISKNETKDMPFKEANEYIKRTIESEKKKLKERTLSLTKNSYTKIKSPEGDEVCLLVYFDKEYGKRTGKFKDLNYATARMCKKEDVVKADEEKKAKEEYEALLAEKKEIEEIEEELRKASLEQKERRLLNYEPIDKDFMIPDEEEERFLEAGGQHFNFYQDQDEDDI